MKSKQLYVCLAGLLGTIVQCATDTASVTWNASSNQYSLHDGLVENPVAVAHFRNEVNTTGWSFLDITTKDTFSDDVQSYAAGVVEGYLTATLIDMHWINTVQGYCEEPLTPYCSRLKNFLETNLNWMRSQIKSNNGKSDYWNMVENFLIQVDGLYDGYTYRTAAASLSGWTTNIDPFGMYMFQVGGDFEDLEAVLKKSQSTRVLGSGSCSALIKLLPGNQDLYVSHDTWSSYQSMLRILKSYDFAFHLEKKASVPGKKMIFSSYPGTILSGDDYYLLSSGLATLETTIGNSNADLWKYVQPTKSVLEGIRVMVSNRLATSGAAWTDMFSKMNSGTYNNQWMIVDYNKFVPGSYNMTGLLYVLEQIPSYIKSADVTNVLLKQSYWPSYNIPYFPTVFNMSGGNEAVQKYGDWFSYNGSPRAKIFKRDNSNIKNLQSMIKVMRYNDFTHDPLSRCNCTPPYSGENAISARSDLNPANGTYPFGALGHRSHGGTDMKLTNSTMFQHLKFIAVSGPTFDQQPPFQWSRADFAPACPHQGHPDLFRFGSVYFDGTTTYKPYNG